MEIKSESLRISIEKLRVVHKLLYSTGETELANEVHHVLLKAMERRKCTTP